LQERRRIASNVNDSKNTRLSVLEAIDEGDVRKDVLVHLNRYLKTCETIIELGNKLKRPLRILDVGCGNLYIPVIFYKAYQVKKSDYIEVYKGVDIDDICLDKFNSTQARVVEKLNVITEVKDLTVNPKFKEKNGYYDLIIWFENIEHIKPEFVEPITKELSRLLSKEGVMLASTPNATGSREKLPVDHVYEWSYKELSILFSKYFSIIENTGIVIQIPFFKKHIKGRVDQEELMNIYESFKACMGNTFLCIALAPLVPPELSKNVFWKLGRK